MSHYNIENDKAGFKNVSVNANVMSISMFKLQIYNSDILIPNEKWHQCKQGIWEEICIFHFICNVMTLFVTVSFNFLSWL